MSARGYLIIIACGCLALAGCTVQVSRIVVSPGVRRPQDLAVTRAACAEIAARYGLTLTPPETLPRGVVEYAQPLPPFGYGGPSIALSTAEPNALAIITISSTGVSDAYRYELTSETVAALQRRLGHDRVRYFEAEWTDF